MDPKQEKVYIGIRAEDKSYWERRTPLPPENCKRIMEQHPNIQFIVQPSYKRIFTNQQYRDVGCIVEEDLTRCGVIVCIKEIPIHKYIPNKTYIHWSHTIKAQEQNMAALDKMLELNVRHIDYERIFNERGVNVTAFPYAGVAGIITFFNEFGKLLLKKDLNTPFLSIGPTYQYYKKQDAYKALREAGEAIKERGIPKEIGLPLIVGVLGSTGLCGRASMEALSNLPITIIRPEEMKDLVNHKDDLKHRFTIYVVPFQTTDLVRCTEDYDQVFTSKDYYEHPQNYTPVFHSKWLPYLTVIVVDIFWDCQFPRYVTNTQMKQLVESGKSRLQAVCDVTCDLQGSIQFLKKYTTPDDPVYYYDPITEEIHDKFDVHNPDHIMYMAIDFLPSQLPYDASVDFGEALQDIIPQIAYSDPNQPLDKQGLPKYLQDAVITLHGQLTPKFKYIDHLRQMNQKLKQSNNYQAKKALKKVPSYSAIKLSGHLFDTGAINKIVDTLSQSGCKFNLVGIEVGAREGDISHMQIQLYSKIKGELMDEIGKIHDLAEELGIQVDADF